MASSPVTVFNDTGNFARRRCYTCIAWYFVFRRKPVTEAAGIYFFTSV
jgi:hypothetical protein